MSIQSKSPLLLVVAVFFLFSTHEVEAAGIEGPNPYTHCGIGAMIFPETRWAAIVSNVIWDLGTTAIVSATASPETCKGRSLVIAEFIATTYDSLVAETARGQGQNLDAILELYECDASVKSPMVNDLRNNYFGQLEAETYATSNPIEKFNTYYQTIDQLVKNQYAKHCAS